MAVWVLDIKGKLVILKRSILGLVLLAVAVAAGGCVRIGKKFRQ